MRRDSIFISYSRQDNSSRQALQKHLEVVLGNPPTIRIFADSAIEVGEKWRRRIHHELDRALVVVLLVSADFLTSEFVQSVEVPHAALAARRGETVIASLYVRPAAVGKFEIHVNDPTGGDFRVRITDYQGINDPAEPLLLHKGMRREQLLVQAADEIVRLAHVQEGRPVRILGRAKSGRERRIRRSENRELGRRVRRGAAS